MTLSGHAHWCVRKSLGLREGGLEVVKNLFWVKNSWAKKGRGRYNSSVRKNTFMKKYMFGVSSYCSVKSVGEAG